MILKLSKSAEGLKIPPVRQDDLYILWYVQYNSLSNWHATHFCILFLTLFPPSPQRKGIYTKNLHCSSLNFFFSKSPKYINLFPQISGIKASSNSSIPPNITQTNNFYVLSAMNLFYEERHHERLIPTVSVFINDHIYAPQLVPFPRLHQQLSGVPGLDCV